MRVFQAEGRPPLAAMVLAPGQWSAPIGRVGMKQTHPLRWPAGRSPRRCGCCSSLLAFPQIRMDPCALRRTLNL